MAGPTPRLRDVYPDSPQGGLALRVNEVPPSRYWMSRRAIAILVAGFAAAIVTESALIAAGQLAFAALAGACFVLAAGGWSLQWLVTDRHAVDIAEPAPERWLPWTAWIESRGLQPGADEAATRVLTDQLRTPLEPLRRPELLTSRLASGVVGSARFPITVASSDYRVPVDPRGTRFEVRTSLFVLLRLPQGAAAVYGGSSFERRRDPWRTGARIGGRRVEHTESVDFDRNCTMRVFGDPRSLQWKELLHPAFLEELANHRDIRWFHLDQWLCVPVGEAGQLRVPSHRLDTACANAAWLAEQFTRAALGDVPGASLDAA